MPEPTQALERETVDAAEPEPTEPEPRPELQPDAIETTEHGEPTSAPAVEAIEIVAEPEPAPEPRLGFFARLFGRRRSRREHEPLGEFEAPVEAAWSAVEQASPELPMYEQPDLAPPDAPVPNVEVAVEPFESAPDAPAMVETAATTDTPATSDMPAMTDTPVTSNMPEGVGQVLIDTAEPQPPDASTELNGQAPTDTAEPPDISAELAEAEQPTKTDAAATTDGAATTDVAATEDVTAVLTSALDRLGAAHHRPFSRA